MKQLSLFVICIFSLFLTNSHAAIVTINVVNNQFNPANVNVSVGDVVRFHFMQGFHNAVSTAVPSGAQAINSGAASANNPRDYDYTVTEAGAYNYYCVIHSDGVNGMVGSFTASGALPVVFRDFSVVANTAKMPAINWQTLSEENVSHFILKSSTDGVHFNEVIKVTATGTNGQGSSYSYQDSKIPTHFRFIYYELVIVDKDGRQTFSPIKMFKTAFAAKSLVMSLSPNPIARPGQLMIQFNAEKAGAMNVQVIGSNGKLVMQSKMQAMPGLNNAHLHVCDLSAGVYNLVFNYEGINEVKRIVIK